MGTSRPKPDAPPSSPLIPPWAEHDPLPPILPPDPLPEDPVPEPEADPGLPADEIVDGIDDADTSEIAEPRRYAGFRTALRRFAASGERADARTALGRWVNKSMGGGSPAARRMARAAHSGGALLVALANASTGLPTADGGLDIRSLAGQPTETAINAIVDAFLPSGILDEMTARLAMEEALTLALGGPDTFDPSAITVDTVRIATLAFVAELVFVQVASDAGRSLATIGPVAAAQREADIRSLIKEVVDVVGTPLLAEQGSVVTEQRMSLLVSQVLREALEEIGTW